MDTDQASAASRFEEQIHAIERALRDRIFTAMDTTRIVEVGVDSAGRVVEVSLDTSVLRTVDGHALATAFLGAARAAQQRAVEGVAEQRKRHLGM